MEDLLSHWYIFVASAQLDEAYYLVILCELYYQQRAHLVIETFHTLYVLALYQTPLHESMIHRYELCTSS